MTEEEAKTKWCPFSRVSPWPANGSYNRITNKEGAAYTNCIASSCMVWRTHNYILDTAGYSQPNTKGLGYCGLAGTPDD